MYAIAKWKWMIAAMMVAMSVGCATDNPMDPDNGRTDPNACSNPCEAGETQCNGATVEACAADSNGCFRWVAGVDCAADGAMCDDSTEPAICLTEPGTCQDGAVNQDESDIDCGGQRCVACGLGDTCDSADDCETNNCDLGNTDSCVPEDQETCTDGSKNQDETDVDCGGGTCPACEEAAECVVDTDCASGTCDNGSCAPDAGPCTDGDVQCAGNTVQSCDQGQWTETQICAQGCAAGACDDSVQCNPMDTRCFKNSVQQCNATGSAWQHLDICNDECNAGLCTGACQPGALRCNGTSQEVCDTDGQTWVQQEDCTLGCSQRVCVEDALSNKGVPMTMSGAHVYQGCVDVELGGSIEIPADETLEIWAKCLNVTSSSSIIVGSGARFIFHATETIVNDGSISGGDFVRLDAYQSLTNSGDISSGELEVRGDVLTNSATGTIGGNYAYALYGSELVNDGTIDGNESVMPPETLSSPTHPEGFQWNMNDDDVSIAWNKPFASVKGYYLNVNASQVPAPGTAEFTDVENVTLPLSMFRPGINQVSVVSVNDDSSVGTYEAHFEIDFNVAAPNVGSTSHTDPFEWSSTDDVFLEWNEASSVDPDSYVGYWYAWNHRADTHPDQNSGTFRNDDKILFDSQASGVWKFHIVSIDRLGRTSPIPGRYEVRIGPDPGAGNIAGSIKDENGEPLRGASVLLNGGVYRATSVASGDYTFRGEVPAAAFDWEVQVQAPGYVPMSQTARVANGAVELLDFQLQRDNAPPTYELGFEIEVDSSGSVSRSQALDIAMGRPGEVIYSTSRSVGIVSTTGSRLKNISASSYYGERVDVGYEGNYYYATNLAYCSGYRCPQVQIWDVRHDPIFSQIIYDWRNYYGPSMVWDGSRFVVVGGYTTPLIGEIDPNDTDNIEGYATGTYSLGGSSNIRSNSLYDGSAIAVAYNAYVNGEYRAVFGRWTKDGTEVQSPTPLAEAYPNRAVGLAYDGQRYHVTFPGRDAKTNGKYPLYIQSVDKTGSVGPLTELEDDNYTDITPSVAFDGRNLLVTYIADGRGYLEIRSPSDYAIIDTFDLGEIYHVGVDFGFHAGAGSLIYARTNADPGTFIREIRVR